MCLFGSKPGKSRRLGSVSFSCDNHAVSLDLRRLQGPHLFFLICALGNNRKEPRSNDLGPAIIYWLVVIYLTTVLDALNVVKQRLVKITKPKFYSNIRGDISFCVHPARAPVLSPMGAEHLTHWVGDAHIRRSYAEARGCWNCYWPHVGKIRALLRLLSGLAGRVHLEGESKTSLSTGVTSPCR